MRRTCLAIATAAMVFSAGSLLSTRADAMTLPAPAGIRAAIVDSSMIDQAYHVCRRVRVCGYYGCRWAARCYPHRHYYRRYY